METPKSIININDTKLPHPQSSKKNSQPSKPRPLTSKPLSKNRPPTTKVKSRPKSSFPISNLDNKVQNKNSILNFIKNDHFNPNNNKNANMDFRTIRPSSNYQNSIFNKYWESTSIEPKSAIIPKIINPPYLQENFSGEVTFVERVLNGDRNLYRFPQIDWSNKNPKSFLSHVGGSDFNLSTTDTKFSSRPTSSLTNDKNYNTVSLLNRNLKNKDRPFTAIERLSEKKRLMTTSSNEKIEKNEKNEKNEKKDKNINKKIRPTTANPSSKLKNNLISNNKENIPTEIREKLEKEYKKNYEYDDSFFDEDENNDIIEDEDIFLNKENNYKYYPHVDSLMRHYALLNVKNYSIKTAQADTDLLEIFDRSQRTLAASLAKVGDYTYYTSYQRIGSFIDFSEHMKWDDLKNIETHINQTKNNEVSFQSKHNIQPPNRQIALVNLCPHFNDPNSMFHGFMPFENEGINLISEINKANKNYDPIDFLPKYTSDDIFNEDLYNEDFAKSVITSINNYNKYLCSSKITIKDMKKFNRNGLKKKIISKINFSFDSFYKKLLNTNLSEIEELYYDTLKRTIMNYILRSPHERKRLNIIYYPRKVLPSTYTIAQHGSFNRNKYNEWVENYTNAFNYLEKNLSLCNIAISGLIEWTQCFDHVSLIYIKNLNSLKDKESNTIQIDEFCKIEESYMQKVLRFIRDIYYRGAVLICKKNKNLKRKDMPVQGRWTFKGFITKNEEFEEFYNDLNYGMNYEDQLNDFWTNTELQDLIDIRLTPSNLGYVTYMLKKQIDLNSNDYDELSTEGKIKLNNSVTAYCQIFFRKLTERALNEFCEFFEHYPSNENIIKDIEKNPEKNLNFVADLKYTEKDIKLPDLSTFKITPYVEPIISIRTLYDNIYNIVRLEYNFDQVNEKIVHVIDVLCGLFNSICTTHFLEFKKILPSQREKIVKEHSSKLNDYFNADPNQNKSFLEEYYKNLCPNLIIEEVETEHYMKTYLSIIYHNENFLSDIKSKIYRKIKIQYSEIDECLKVFDPLKEVITNSFDETIKAFVDIYNATPDYLTYMKYLEKIQIFENYIDIIPDKLQYSMFAIDNRQTKKDLRDKLEGDKTTLMKSLEDEIISAYDKNIEKFSQLLKMIEKKLTTPQEVVEMEKTKMKVSSEYNGIIRDFEDSYKIFLFLIKSDDIFSSDIINKTSEGIRRYNKFKQESEKIENMHRLQREQIEEKFLKEKEELEEDINKFLEEINLLDNQTHINEYGNVVATLEYLEDKTPKFEERIEKNIEDDELLHDYKNEGFDNFNLAKNKLSKLGVLWRNIQSFYEERKVLIHNFSEEVDIEQYLETFKEIDAIVSNNRRGLRKEEEIVGKMSKILEDDIENINTFLVIIHKVILSPKPMNDDLRKEVMEVLENKSVEQSCREILFTYFSKKD